MRKKPASALLNIRHGLSREVVDLFRRQADARNLTHGEWLTELVLEREEAESTSS